MAMIDSPQQAKRMGALTQFAIKTAIITAAFIVGITFITRSVFSNLNLVLRENIEIVRADIQSFKKMGGKDFWNKLEHELERAAQPRQEIPPERKAKMLANLRIISDRWRPVILEVSDIVMGTPSTSLATPAKK